MGLPWKTVARMAARLVVWVAPRLDKSPAELIKDAAGEGVKEGERWQERRANPTRSTMTDHAIPLIPEAPPKTRRRPPTKPAA